MTATQTNSLTQPTSADEARRAVIAQFERHVLGGEGASDYYMIRRLQRPYTEDTGVKGVTRSAEQVAWLEAARKDLETEFKRWLSTL